MSYVLCPLSACPQYFASNGSPLSGGTISFYGAGTTTPQTVYNSATGAGPATSITLDASGRLQQEIWQPSGVAIKAVIADSNGNMQGIALDNISGINDTSSLTNSEWVASGFTPVYSTASQFSTTGDSVTTFQVGRRIQAAVSAGTVYGTVTSSSYGTATTVNVAMDSGQALDSGLSAVNVGLLNGLHPSVPSPLPYLTIQASNIPDAVISNVMLGGPRVKVTTFTTSGTFTPTAGVTITKVTCVGGGGGGGGAATTSSTEVSVGDGGDSGYTVVAWLTPAQIGSSQAVTIGAGGAGNVGNTGSPGGNTTFGSLVTADGGNYGKMTTAVPPFISGGTIFGANQGGQANSGETAIAISTGSFLAGAGAASLYSGYSPRYYQPGASGMLYGGGGAGTANGVSAGTAYAGGAGAPGICIIEEYF